MQRLTVPVVDRFIADLKDSVHEARANPTGKGTMVAVYGACARIMGAASTEKRGSDQNAGVGKMNAVGPSMVGKLATIFLDTLYLA
jgi:sphinganine-1-phosphate aldolase